MQKGLTNLCISGHYEGEQLLINIRSRRTIRLREKDMSMSNDLVKIGEASKALGVSIDTLRRWEAKGKINAIRTPGGTRLYSLTEIQNIVPQTVSESFLEKPAGIAPSDSNKSLDLESLWESSVRPQENLGKSRQINPKTYATLGLAGLVILIILGVVGFNLNLEKFKNLEVSKKLDIANFEKNNTLSLLNTRISALEGQLTSALPQVLGEETSTSDNTPTTYSYYIPQPVLTTTVNLLRNSSFEANSSGQPTYWSYMDQSTSHNTFVNNGSVRTGNHSLRIQPNDSNTIFGIYQPYFGTLLDRDYTLSLYLDNQSNQNLILRLSFWDRVNNTKVLTKDFHVNSTSGWRRYSYTIDPLNTYPMIEVVGLTQGNVYIDDVDLSEGSVTSTFDIENSYIGDGSIYIDPNGNIYPVTDKTGSLGLINMRFNSLYLAGATIDPDGNTSIAGNLSVAGTSNISRLLLDDGTASKPSLAFANDTDTGLFRPSSDVIGFTTGGTERVRIDGTAGTLQVTSPVTSGTGTSSGLSVTANSLTSGYAGYITSNSTAGTGSGSSYLLYLDRSGANSNATHTAYGVYSTVANTGTTNTNYGGYFAASGASNANISLHAEGGTNGTAGSNIGLNIGAFSGTNTTAAGRNYGIVINDSSADGNLGTIGINIGSITGAASSSNQGINIGNISGTPTANGIVMGTLSSNTSTGYFVNRLSGATANVGVNIANVSGTGTGTVFKGGPVTTTGANNMGLELGTMTGASSTNYQIHTGNITAVASATNAGLVLGTTKAVTGTAASSTNYGININPIDSTGTTNYGIFIGAVSGATTNYGLFTTSGTTVLNGTSGNVGIGDTDPTEAKLVIGSAGAGNVFLTLDTTGTTNDAVCWDNSGATLLYDCDSTPADYAESYPVESGVSFGEIVMTSNEMVTTNIGTRVPKLVRATTGGKVIGITSDNYHDFTSAGKDEIRSEDNPMPVALNGRVLVKISQSSQAVEVGDYLTVSSEAGKATKATYPTQMVGKALESWTPASGKDKIMVFVSSTFADPQNLLANLTLDSDGTLIVPKIKTDQLTLNGLNVTDLVAVSSSLDFSNLITVGTPISSDKIVHNSQTLSEVINELESWESTTSGQIAGLQAQVASQSASLAESVDHTTNKLTDLSSKIDDLLASVQGTGESKQAEASSSANLTDPSLLVSTDSASLAKLNITDTLFAKDINISSTLHSLDATISGTLKSLGDTFLGNTTIAGDITQDGTLSLSSGNSINSIDTLFIQSSPLAKLVDFFNGLVTIDKEGQLAAKEVKAEKLTLTKAAGQGVIKAGTSEVAILNDLVKSNSIISLTLETSSNSPIYLGDRQEGVGFVAKLPNSASEDIKFSYIIIGR